MQQLNYEEILRLPYGKGIGSRNIAQVLGYPKTMFGTFLQGFKGAGIFYPLPENVELRKQLYKPTR